MFNLWAILETIGRNLEFQADASNLLVPLGANPEQTSLLEECISISVPFLLEAARLATRHGRIVPLLAIR